MLFDGDLLSKKAGEGRAMSAKKLVLPALAAALLLSACGTAKGQNG